MSVCERYNAMEDSLTPIGGMVLLVNMLLGEVVFGGIGSHMVSMMAALHPAVPILHR